jgi:hypothetical protein
MSRSGSFSTLALEMHIQRAVTLSKLSLEIHIQKQLQRSYLYNRWRSVSLRNIPWKLFFFLNRGAVSPFSWPCTEIRWWEASNPCWQRRSPAALPKLSLKEIVSAAVVKKLLHDCRLLLGIVTNPVLHFLAITTFSSCLHLKLHMLNPNK